MRRREAVKLWVMCHLRPPSDRRHDRWETCVVCGHRGRLVHNRWLLPRELREKYGHDLVVRETSLCRRCGSTDRTRGLARVLIDLYGSGDEHTLGELVRSPSVRHLAVAEINSIGRLHGVLDDLPRLTYVEYPEEDVQALSWKDESFDLVLTSETLEHVGDPRQGLRETYRVLRPGGRHVFTVPITPGLATTRTAEGLPVEHHGGGGGPFSLIAHRSDMKVRTFFGADIAQVVADEGFDVDTSGDGWRLVVVATRPR